MHERAIDFGRDSKQMPKKVITPAKITDIKNIFINLRDEKIAIRGKAHSTGGQTLVEDGIVIDMTACSGIAGITKNSTGDMILETQAGALWKNIFKYCLSQGLMPPTYSDWLDLTVGGTLSTGGVGQCTFNKGLQIDNVDSLEVVLTSGDIIICNRKQHRELFDLVRGGFGQYGVISRAWIRLEKAPQKVFVYKLLYADLASFLNAQRQLLTCQNIDAVQSHVSSNEREDLSRRIGKPISEELYKALPRQTQYFLLEVTKYASDQSTLDTFKTFIASFTRHDPAFIFSQETSFEQHVNRVPPLLDNPLEKSLPQHHHCCFFVSADRAKLLLTKVFSNPDHCAAMGKGNILIIPMKRAKINAPYFMLPDSDDIFFIGIFRRHLQPYPFNRLVQLNEETYQLAITLGARIYPVGSGSFLKDPEYWKSHYKNHYDTIVQAKDFYDPEHLLTPNIEMDVPCYSARIRCKL